MRGHCADISAMSLTHTALLHSPISKLSKRISAPLPAPNAAPDPIALAQQHLVAGNLEQAAAIARQNLKRRPKCMASSYLLGLALSRKGDLVQAAHYLQGPASMREAQRDCQCEYGRVLFEIGRFEEGLDFLARATITDPRSDYAWDHFCRGLYRSGYFAKAIKAGEKAVELNPSLAGIMMLIGSAWASLACHDEAVRWMGRGVQAAPEDIEVVGVWANFLNYIDTSPQHIETAVQRCNHAARLSIPAYFNDVQAARTSAVRPVRIGLLSPDMCNHPVARFMLPLLKNLDPTNYDITVYNLNPVKDHISKEIARYVGAWHDVGHLSLASLGPTIAEAQHDVLIDLAGWTRRSGASLLVNRLAPLQMTYLGYPNVTGIDGIDVRLTDSCADITSISPHEYAAKRAESQANASLNKEKLVAIEGSGPFVCWEPPAKAPDITPRNPAARLTFGCFNYLGKLSSRCLKLWAKLMASLPESQLVIKGKGLGDPQDITLFKQALSRAGLDLSRIELRGIATNYTDHLRAYNDIDIALDSLPYNGTTTTCEALWMGVPVLTLPGLTHASRVGATLLRAVGMDAQWCAMTESAFIAQAIAASQKRDELALSRQSLREKVASSSLCDGRAFAERFGRTLTALGVSPR